MINNLRGQFRLGRGWGEVGGLVVLTSGRHKRPMASLDINVLLFPLTQIKNRKFRVLKSNLLFLIVIYYYH